MSSLLIQEVPLMVLPTLATKIGLNEAMFLQQLHYWIDRSKHEMEGHRWIYNTIEDWCKQFPFWSRRTIVRVISSLERHGLVLTANYNRKGFDRTKWYTVNYELLAKMEAEPMPSTPSPMEKGGDNQLDEAQPEDAPGVAPAPIENGTQAPDAENPVPEANPVDGTSMMPNWHNEENQGFAASDVGGTSIVPKWHNEERRGLTGNSSSTAAVGGTSMMPDWHPPLCQNDTMECANLAQPIPENNYRDYTEKTTTPQDTESSREKSAESEQESLLLLLAPRYGIQEETMRKYIQKFGLELVLKEFSLLKKLLEQKKPIQNPAGWLRRALEEQYADAGADLEKVRQEKQADIEAKNQARKEFYERQLREEQEKDRTEVDESNPFYGYFLRHCKQDGDKGKEENGQSRSVET